MSNFPLGWWWDKVKLLLLSSVWSLYWWFWTDNSVPYFLTTILYWSYLFSKTCIHILSKKIAYCILNDAYYVLEMVHGNKIRWKISNLDFYYNNYQLLKYFISIRNVLFWIVWYSYRNFAIRTSEYHVCVHQWSIKTEPLVAPKCINRLMTVLRYTICRFGNSTNHFSSWRKRVVKIGRKINCLDN